MCMVCIEHLGCMVFGWDCSVCGAEESRELINLAEGLGSGCQWTDIISMK